jgi:O-antigen/teichoic acid export membrane protein
MLIFALVILFTSFEIFFFGLILIAASWVMDELAGWTVFVGNVLAAGAMLAFYFRRHRALAHRLSAAWDTDDS